MKAVFPVCFEGSPFTPCGGYLKSWSDVSRRQFLGASFGVLAAGVALPGRLWGVVRRDPGHPTPRPGITAENVLPDSDLSEYPAAIPAFQAARQVPQVLDGIRCQCGCADVPGFYSLLSCYERAGMARMCDICQGEARYASRLFAAGKSLDEIRAAIDARYG